MNTVIYRSAPTLPNHVRAAIRHADIALEVEADGCVVVVKDSSQGRPGRRERRMATPAEIRRAKWVRT